MDLKNIKSLFSKKADAGNSGVDLSQIKTNTQTADNIISNTVSNSRNISSVTLSKQEQAQLLEKRKKVPIGITVLKFSSLSFLVATIVTTLLLAADLDPTNQYLGLLGAAENTGSKFTSQSQLKHELEQNTAQLKKDIESLQTRSKNFEDTDDEKKIGLLVPEIAEIENLQRRWFNETVTYYENEDSQTEKKIEEFKYGLIDSFDFMVKYFEDAKYYQPRFFNEKRRNESLTNGEPEICRIPDHKLTESQVAEKQRKQNTGQCVNINRLFMVNDVEIRGLNINANSANVTVTLSDILSRVFTLSSEFVAMMNSFPFYKGAEITNFTRRELPEGGNSTELALRLEYQTPEEEDPYDQFFVDLQEWQAEKTPEELEF